MTENAGVPVREQQPSTGLRDDTAFPDLSAPLITVVIVDDHVMVAECLADALNLYPDISVLAVSQSCAAGLKAVAEHRPTVLVLDQQLPDGLGTDMLAELLRISPALKVLLVTGRGNDDDLARAIKGGAAGMIPKGKQMANLVKAVRAVANDEAVITPEALRRLMPRLSGRNPTPGADLTAREREVLTLLTAGKSTADVTSALFVARATTRNHIQSIMNKLGAHTRLEAVAIAARENVLPQQ
jgi:DNA-binding NarL/FixJ family response regulator